MQKAKSLARTDDGPGTLWVVINSDEQAAKKKGKEFMPANERLKLVRALRFVDACIIAPDSDHTVCKAIAAIHPDVFAIGLDEGQEYMKEEKELCKQMGIQVFYFTCSFLHEVITITTNTLQQIKGGLSFRSESPIIHFFIK